MKKKVLVVDDSAIMRRIVSEILAADDDLEICGEAPDGAIALEQAEKLHPDLVILDIEMPNMNGLECLKRLKLVCNAKVIILSSIVQAGSKSEQQARRFGAFDVVPKPAGATSLNLKAKSSHEITQAARKAVGLG